MSRVLLAHADHGQAVGTALGRQIEVHDLGELLLQQRHENLVEGDAEDGRFIRGAPGVGAVINRRFAAADGGHGEHGEAFDFVVVTGVVAKGPLVGLFTGL